ncbi:hypothetical protein DFQ01_1397 [Paenibacillus cellulosilyticus]|uniref:Uncharacterized protein n=1 Tax=Paenibacillus cellulosilyticus TaxID=375489 RepID=A0A2V2YHJ1_9BACL|nr:hypothetical protein [Paenibacillus cellulosilyticus]PWV90957.1 hypothetical protein DFQ01_1397 [Paenibacillus cellulosilyticus]QKS45175.1 hypothetical protein HUB94_12690 [Paenibacillus cellulosilyticus]
MGNWLVSVVLRTLFHPAPASQLTEEERSLFDRIYEEGCARPDRTIQYELSTPKYKFLAYLAQTRGVILHGSNNTEIEQFEPRRQTLFNNQLVTAVFGTKDPIWSIFYAVFRRAALIGNFRNGAVSAGSGGKAFHFYSLTKATMQNDPWTNGVVYILQNDQFKSSGGVGGVYFDEWTNEQPIEPIARLPVGPNDFPFLDKVGTHLASESVGRTWLLYKIRSWR